MRARAGTEIPARRPTATAAAMSAATNPDHTNGELQAVFSTSAETVGGWPGVWSTVAVL
jgi:hypothetical protein